MAWRSMRLPGSGTSSWVLVDDGFEMHPECRSFVMWLLARSASTETIRAYVPRVGRYLNWCEGAGAAWRDVRLNDLARFKFSLEQTTTGSGQRLAGKSVNAVLIAVVTFLRFCAAHGLIDAQSVERLHERPIELAGRLRQVEEHNTELAGQLSAANARSRQVEAKLATTQDELAAARESLRRMIKQATAGP